MLTSSGQGRQLVNGFTNREQRQKDISDNVYGVQEARSENGCQKGHMKQARDLENRAAHPNTNSGGLRPPRYQWATE